MKAKVKKVLFMAGLAVALLLDAVVSLFRRR